MQKNRVNNNAEQVKVRIVKISAETIDCRHLSSDLEIKAFYKSGMDLSIGQIVLLRFKRSEAGSAYIVDDPLINYIYGDVLEAHHFIQEDMLFTSVIIQVQNKKRMHSLAASNTKIFGETSILVKGDKVKIKQNDGMIFGISIEQDGN